MITYLKRLVMEINLSVHMPLNGLNDSKVYGSLG